MNRYRPARQYLPASLVAAGLALFSVWCGMRWQFALIPAGLFLVSSLVLYYLAIRPPIEIRESDLRIGSRLIRWAEVARVDSTKWTSPLVLDIRLQDGRQLRMIYPGDEESAGRLLRQIRRLARVALIDGLPYREYWGEVIAVRGDGPGTPSPRYRLLRPEDEADVERLFQRLKTVGRLDRSSSSEEHQD